MVLSGLIVRHELLAPLYRFFPMKALFGLPPASAAAFLLGMLCGFPVGAKTVCGLYDAGAFGKREAEETAALSNNTGPAFAVSVAGGAMWGSRAFGWYLYAAQIFSAVVVGVVFHLFSAAFPKEKRGGKTGTNPEKASKPVRVTGSRVTGSRIAGTKPANPFSSLLASLTESAAACVSLAGIIVFFAVLCAFAKALFPPRPAAVLCALLEFTSGIGISAKLGGRLGLFLTGFSLGFSGLSVFLQSYRFTADAGLSLRPAFAKKLLQGLLCGFLCTLFPVSP